MGVGRVVRSDCENVIFMSVGFVCKDYRAHGFEYLLYPVFFF